MEIWCETTDKSIWSSDVPRVTGSRRSLSKQVSSSEMKQAIKIFKNIITKKGEKTKEEKEETKKGDKERKSLPSC